MHTQQKPRRQLKIVLLSVAALLVAAVAAFLIYASVYYPADEDALAALPAGITLAEGDGYIACAPASGAPTAGFILYPGGKVDARAYLPYLAEVAQQGYLCAVVQVPLRLAMFAPDAASRVRAAYPDVRCWVVGGHSLGGVVAAGYAAKNPVDGLVLLAAYPSADLSEDTALSVLSITASQDEVLNWDNYEKAKDKLPPATQYTQVEGGNHSGFGAYGQQKGDGVASISAEEQRRVLADATAAFLAECCKTQEAAQAA